MVLVVLFIADVSFASSVDILRASWVKHCWGCLPNW